MPRDTTDYTHYDPEIGIPDEPAQRRIIPSREANNYDGPLECADCYSKQTLLPVRRVVHIQPGQDWKEITVLLCQVCRHTATIGD